MISTNSLWRYNDEESALEFADSGDILNDYQELFKTLFSDISMDENTPQAQICAYLAELDSVTIKAYAQMANFQFNGGAGEFLDFWAWNKFRAARKNAILGTVTITAQGVAGTEIPAGFTVSDGSQNFATNADAVIPQSGSIDILATQTELSEEIALAGTVTQQVTPIVGVETVTNAASSTAGIPLETDAQLRERCYKFNSLFKNSSFRSVLSNLAQIAGVSKIAGYENPTGATVTYKGASFPAHSFGVVLIGGDSDEIAQTIAKCKALGCATTGAVSVAIGNSNYYFSRATAAPLAFSVTARIHPTSPVAWREMVYTALTQFVEGLEIGAYFTQSQAARALENYIGGAFQIDDLQIARQGGALGYAPISLNFTENATILSSDITIFYNQG